MSNPPATVSAITELALPLTLLEVTSEDQFRADGFSDGENDLADVTAIATKHLTAWVAEAPARAAVRRRMAC